MYFWEFPLYNVWGLGGPLMSSELSEFLCEWYHNPREWNKTLAENIWETFYLGQFWDTLIISIIFFYPNTQNIQMSMMNLQTGSHDLSLLMSWKIIYPIFDTPFPGPVQLAEIEFSYINMKTDWPWTDHCDIFLVILSNDKD